MKVYTYTNEELTRLLNKGLLATVNGLLKEKYLTEDQANKILQQNALFISEPSMFNSVLSKVLFSSEQMKKEDFSAITFVKVI